MSADQNATFHNVINTGVTLTEDGDATFHNPLNTGLPLPHRTTIVQPQMGWGVPITPEQSGIVVDDAAKATFYAYEGDVTTP